jgi:SAM-dependent methyltransferase
MYKFVDSNIKVHTGEEAKKRFLEHNDSKFLSSDGIVSVSKERWEEAQSYEYKTWMKQCLNFKDDHNIENVSNFENFDVVDFGSIKDVIELGSGPFTNIRLITDKLPNVKCIDLLDPLINDYINHPNCSYKNNKMEDKNIVTHNTSIEDFQPTKKYDLVILINVLEHCRDINVVFEKVYNVLNESGFIIFGDVIFNPEFIKNDVVNFLYNSGHPIRISYEFVDKFISKFNQLFLNKKEHKLMDAKYYYFIGRK